MLHRITLHHWAFPLVLSLVTLVQPSLALAQPLPLVSAYLKYRESREISEKLDQVHKDLEDIKGDLNLIIDSHLKAAMTALGDAKHMKSQNEKIDSIRSAKHFLTQAINIEKSPERKALAYYILGHVYLLLNEEVAAKRHFKKVVRFEYGVETGLWNKTKVYEPAITHLKREASGLLCSYQEQAERIKDDWCALYIGYRDASLLDLTDLEECVRSEDQARCEQVGTALLASYIDRHEKQETEREFSLKDPFQKQHHDSVKHGKNFLYEPCTDLKDISRPNHFKACYWRAQVLLHQSQLQDSFVHYRVVCQSWLSHVEISGDDDLALNKLGSIACQSLYQEPLWPLVPESDRSSLIKRLCLDGDLKSCEQLLKSKHFYHSDLLDNVSDYVAHRCLMNEDKAACDTIDDSRNTQRASFKIQVGELEIGLKDQESLWDPTGDSNPEPLLEISIGHRLVYHQSLTISKITSDASGNPLTYTLKPRPSDSIFIDKNYLKGKSINISLKDLDPLTDDLIGYYEISTHHTEHKLQFGAVKKMNLKLVPLSAQ